MAETLYTTTRQGMELIGKLIKSSAQLTLTRAAMANAPLESPYEAEALAGKTLPLSILSFEIEEGDPLGVEILVYTNNEDLRDNFDIFSIGIFADDPDKGEILLAVAHYPKPDTLPARDASTYYEIEKLLILQVARDLMVELAVEPMDFLTKKRADSLYWRLGTQYPATEITESSGESVETHQRWQDQQLTRIEKRMDEGISTGRTVSVNTSTPTSWRIIDNKGWYDAAAKVFRG